FTTLSFSADGQALASVCADTGQISVWSLEDSPLAVRTRHLLSAPAALCDQEGRWLLALSPDRRWLALARGPDLLLWDWQRRSKPVALAEEIWPVQFAFHPSGRLLACAAGDDTV